MPSSQSTQRRARPSRFLYEENAYLAAKFATFAVTAYLVVYRASYLALRLRRAEGAQRQANQMLRQKDRIKDEYVAHVTHDIKGHLVAIPVAGFRYESGSWPRIVASNS